MQPHLVKDLNTVLPLASFVLSFTTFIWITSWFAGSFNREMFVQPIKSKYMSNQNSEQFGDPNYDYRSVKVGDKDAQGETIATVYYTAENMVIYRTYGHLIVTYSNHAERFSVLNAIKLEISNHIFSRIRQRTGQLEHVDWEKELEAEYSLYAPQLAHAYQMCYLEEYEEALLIAEDVKTNIESKIISQAKYTYSGYYLRCLLWIIGVVFILINWNELILQCWVSIVGISLKIPNWLLWHFYIAAAGIIGSFLSAKEKIASQTIDFNLPVKQTILDVRMRLLLGGVFGILTFWLVNSGIITGLFKASIPQNFLSSEDIEPLSMIIILLVGLVGGFSERLVPDTLKARFTKPSKQKTKENIKKIAASVTDQKSEEDGK